MGESRVGADVDVDGRVGVVGRFKGVRAMDATLKMICEICARSLGAPWVLDDMDDSGRG